MSMNQVPFPYMPNMPNMMQGGIEQRLANIELELKKISELLDQLSQNKKNSYLQKDDNLYML